MDRWLSAHELHLRCHRSLCHRSLSPISVTDLSASGGDSAPPPPPPHSPATCCSSFASLVTAAAGTCSLNWACSPPPTHFADPQAPPERRVEGSGGHARSGPGGAPALRRPHVRPPFPQLAANDVDGRGSRLPPRFPRHGPGDVGDHHAVVAHGTGRATTLNVTRGDERKDGRAAAATSMSGCSSSSIRSTRRLSGTGAVEGDQPQHRHYQSTGLEQKRRIVLNFMAVFPVMASWLDRTFAVSASGSTIKTEVLSGIATFFTAGFILTGVCVDGGSTPQFIRNPASLTLVGWHLQKCSTHHPPPPVDPGALHTVWLTRSRSLRSPSLPCSQPTAAERWPR